MAGTAPRPSAAIVNMASIGYRPRVPMPIVGYFMAVAPCLLALLFIATPAFDAMPPRKDIVAPVRLPGSRVQVAASLPILTVREAPPPPMWALTSNEDQVMAQQHEPMRHPVAKVARRQDKRSKRLVRPHRSGERYIAAATSTIRVR
jgi:hypothetical protein